MKKFFVNYLALFLIAPIVILPTLLSTSGAGTDVIVKSMVQVTSACIIVTGLITFMAFRFNKKMHEVIILSIIGIFFLCLSEIYGIDVENANLFIGGLGFNAFMIFALIDALKEKSIEDDFKRPLMAIVIAAFICQMTSLN